MTKKKMEILAEFLEAKSEVFGYYLEDYRVNRESNDALTKSEIAMATVYEISKAMGIDNAYMIKEAGIRKGKEIFNAGNAGRQTVTTTESQ
ncbi:MAG: hypothetical protein K0R55_3984 [Sporomusa sp.]|nr:hypothetical protein [Sporomusa sp.]